MSEVERYINAGERENTRRSYRGAVRHFEEEYGGFLPASPDTVSAYLARYAGSLAINTLLQRLAALAHWHIEHGFPDPTKASVVKKVLKGIRTLHSVQERQARPIQIAQVQQVVSWLDAAIRKASCANNVAALRSHTRDKALLLLGFWRGFRGDELTRLQVQFIQVTPNDGLTCFLPHTKGDRAAQGTTFHAPALKTLCPVEAYMAWINLAALSDGPVFRAVDRWGHISERGLHINSLVPLLRSLFFAAGLSSPDEFSGHSLRRGFAAWATSNGWDLKTLMQYVGWRDAQSAMRYLEISDPFKELRP
ncbi:site-specific integrase [Massilia sp. BJB1822]|uniref:site-specific integrase n=1 Tax=Massilia sp. BJB1822 TaxID=2744470 RepID=UPI00159408C9|nr:site-specific integrase [Massilia sp. BJB1822]NVD97935.1 site-specific integrase [Massilia sp. BJB1822]